MTQIKTYPSHRLGLQCSKSNHKLLTGSDEGKDSVVVVAASGSVICTLC
jgi:hypothetical protein